MLQAFSLIYGVLTVGLPERSLPNTPGPAFFPWLITGGLLILSAALLTQSLRASGYTAQATPSQVTRRGWIALVAFASYLALLPALGFLTASVPFFAVLTLLYGQRNRLLVVLTAVVVPVVVFVVFRYGFQMLLPRGLWL